MSFVTLVANPRPGSRTRTAAERATDLVAGRIGYTGEREVVDLAGLAPGLLASPPPAEAGRALELVGRARVLLVASPTYKGTYTGLLKVFLDRLPTQALAGTTALPLLVMGDPRHALAVETHLRPLLVELGATVPTPGLALLESEIASLEEVLGPWADRVSPQIALTEGVSA
ncbi:NAD(P)H-dependent oxidoreductase [Sphaerisporangium sp. TRM90804]|uniref:NADPH-dependent FMN reductase n=1 Tax=Sphaerisporangium sp. TRM90804 TaxID=3031113 RepID=UPI00244BCBE8|nr:NAD(P)H-dependent oxidoreductase [Sphaerisporangium sp. TRM90804]MDH2427747.1 NAD(P)H-dependent oxidoreductase [Sphaerisporangium sp. TRM90804]